MILRPSTSHLRPPLLMALFLILGRPHKLGGVPDMNRLNRWIVIVAGVLVAGAGLSDSAHALMVERNLAERAQEADYIALGTVIRQESRKARLKGLVPMIYTEVTIQADRCVKHPQGEAEPTTLVIRVPGGTVGSERISVSDMPTFQTGERVIVILKRHEAHQCHLVSGHQGLFRVIADPVSKAEAVVSATGQPLSVDDQHAMGALTRTPALIPVDLFLEHLKRLAAQEGS